MRFVAGNCQFVKKTNSNFYKTHKTVILKKIIQSFLKNSWNFEFKLTLGIEISPHDKRIFEFIGLIAVHWQADLAV